MTARKPSKRVKAGTRPKDAAHRRELFKQAYIANGHNIKQAAIDAGFSPKTAASQGSRLLTDVNFAAEIAEAEREQLAAASKTTGLTLERVQQELARLAFSDPRKLLRPDGTLIPIHELDDDTAATLASFEVTTVASGNPADADDDEEFEKRKGDQTVVRMHKLKVWDKNAALANAMRHLGMFEKDNSQRGDNIALKVELVG